MPARWQLEQPPSALSHRFFFERQYSQLRKALDNLLSVADLDVGVLYRLGLGLAGVKSDCSGADSGFVRLSDGTEVILDVVQRTLDITNALQRERKVMKKESFEFL